MSFEPDTEEIRLRKQSEDIARIREDLFFTGSAVNAAPPQTSGMQGSFTHMPEFNLGVIGDAFIEVSEKVSAALDSIDIVGAWEYITSGDALIDLQQFIGGVDGQEVTIKPKAGKIVTLNATPTTSASTDGNLMITSDIVLGETDTATLKFQVDKTFSDGVGGWVLKSTNVGAASNNAHKNPVRVATTVNGTLATAFENGDTIDGVTLATGDRILLKNQSTPAQNGIYTVNDTGAPTRATDFNSSTNVKAGTVVVVEEGTANDDTLWILSTNNPIIVDTTGLSFMEFTGSSDNLGNHTATLTLNMNTNQIVFDGIADPGDPTPRDRALYSDSGNSNHLTIRTPSGTVDIEGLTSTNKILQLDSKVEVLDVGAGKVEFTIDGEIRGTLNVTDWEMSKVNSTSILTLFRDDSTPTDADTLGEIFFDGNDSGGTQTTYGKIRMIQDDTTNLDEKGSMFFDVIQDPSGTASLSTYLRLRGDNETIVLEKPVVSRTITPNTASDIGATGDVFQEMFSRKITFETGGALPATNSIGLLTGGDNTIFYNAIAAHAFYIGTTRKLLISDSIVSLDQGIITLNWTDGTDDLSITKGVTSTPAIYNQAGTGGHRFEIAGTTKLLVGNSVIDAREDIKLQRVGNTPAILTLFRDDSSPSLQDPTGEIFFSGRNLSAAEIIYGKIRVLQLSNTATSETGEMRFDVVEGSPSALVSYIRLVGEQEVILFEKDVESNTINPRLFAATLGSTGDEWANVFTNQVTFEDGAGDSVTPSSTEHALGKTTGSIVNWYSTPPAGAHDFHIGTNRVLNITSTIFSLDQGIVQFRFLEGTENFSITKGVGSTPAIFRQDGTGGFAWEIGSDFSPVLEMVLNATKLDIDAKFIEYDEIVTPASPVANSLKVYALDDGSFTRLASLDSAGTETILGGIIINDVLTTTNPSGSINVDVSDHQHFVFDLNANITITFTGLPLINESSEQIVLEFVQDGTGGRTVGYTQTINPSIPSISTAGGVREVVTGFIRRNSVGVHVFNLYLVGN